MIEISINQSINGFGQELKRERESITRKIASLIPTTINGGDAKPPPYELFWGGRYKSEQPPKKKSIFSRPN